MQAVPPASKDLMQAAADIARGAGKITLDWFQSSSLTVETKSDGSPVTQADKAAERYIREQILALTPDASIVGEEEDDTAGSSGLTWYIDPIDGTKGFSRGVPLYSTLIAVCDEHGPAVGVIYIPPTNEIVFAGRGLGAWTDDGPAQVSNVTSVSGSYVTTSSVSRWGEDVFGRINAAGADVRGWGDGYGYLMVATGRVDGMVDLYGGHVWDFAPLPVILSEAGGKFTDLNGEVNFDTPSVVATNGLIHDELLALVDDLPTPE